MSHHFDSGLFFGENAWHGLGVTLDAQSDVRFSVADSIRIAGLNWNVETAPVFVDGAPVAGHKATVRVNADGSRKVLGVVGDRYKPLQNQEQFEWFAPYLESRECAFETCGSLMDGKLVWVLARINRADSVITSGDTIRKYLLLTSSHDGSKATSVGLCDIRVVCWNTLSACLADSRSALLKVKHTASQKSTLATIRDTINLADSTFEATAAQYRKLAACGVSQSDLRKYVQLVLELPDDESAWSTNRKNTLEGIINLCVAGTGNDGKSAWSAYNGVTEYVSHHYGRNADSRLRSAWYGEGKAIAARAFTLAMQLAG